MKLLKFLKFLFLVFLGVSCVDIVFSYTLEKCMKGRYNTAIYHTYNAKDDIVILGASRALHHYNSRILADSLGVSVYNYGVDGQNVYFHLAVLKMIVEHAEKKPNMILLELGAIDLNDTPKWNNEKLSILYPYINSEPKIKDILSELIDPKEFFMIRISSLYRNNSQMLYYIHKLIESDNNDSLLGYVPLINKWGKAIEEKKEHGSAVCQTKLKYINEFINICKQEGIKLLITVSPNYAKLSNEKWKQELKQIASKANVPFLDYEQNELFLNNREWFNEPFHLNKEGADIYTNIIVKEIKAIQDRRL